MTSPAFYKTFKDFEYILIYQLNAFVFYDALEYFCSLGYDYIGASWPYFPVHKVDEFLISSAQKKGISYSKRIVSFWREYINSCEKLFHNLGK